MESPHSEPDGSPHSGTRKKRRKDPVSSSSRQSQSQGDSPTSGSPNPPNPLGGEEAHPTTSSSPNPPNPLGGEAEPDPQDLTSDGKVVRPILLESLLTNRNAEIMDKIKQVVVVMHELICRASACIAYTLHQQCEEEGCGVEDLIDLSNADRVNAMFRGVVRTYNPRNATYISDKNLILQAHGVLFDGMPLIENNTNVYNLDELIRLQARVYSGNFKTMLKTFPTFVRSLVKAKFFLAHDAYEELTKEDKKRLNAFCVTVARLILVNPERFETELNEAHDFLRIPWFATDYVNRWIRHSKAALGLNDGNVWPPGKDSINWLIKAHPMYVVKSMHKINGMMVELGRRPRRLCPMRTNNVPGFISLDEKVLRQLRLMSDNDKKSHQQRQKRRRVDQSNMAELLKEIKRHHAANQYQWVGNLTRQVNYREKKALKKRHKRIESRFEDLFMRRDKRNQQSEVDDAFKSVFNFDSLKEVKRGNAQVGNPQVRVAGLSTDGVSCRVVIEHPLQVGVYESLDDPSLMRKARMFCLEATDPEAFRDAVLRAHQEDLHEMSEDSIVESARQLPQDPRIVVGAAPSRLPRKGLLTLPGLQQHIFGDSVPEVDRQEIDAMSPDQQLPRLMGMVDAHCGGKSPFFCVGADPGQTNLLAVRSTHVSRGGVIEAEDRRTQYTSQSRRFDMQPGHWYVANNKPDKKNWEKSASAKSFRHDHIVKPPSVIEAEQALRRFSSKGSSGDIMSYIEERNRQWDVLRNWYGDERRRKTRWTAFLDDQRSFLRFVKRISELQPAALDAQQRPPLVIAYGSWALSASHISGHGKAPTLSKGLVRKLSRYFVVVLVPEYLTSQRCFKCGGSVKLNTKATEEHRRKREDDRNRKLNAEQSREVSSIVNDNTSDDETRQRLLAQVTEKYDRLRRRSITIRGHQFCQGWKRCLNRDYNSAALMSVNLYRLLFNLPPLFSPSDAMTRQMLTAISIFLECEND